MENKHIVGLIFMVLGGFVLYLSKTILNVSCTGWNMINPICLLTKVLDFSIEIIGIALFIFLVILGSMIMISTAENFKWILGFLLFSVLTILAIFFTPGFPIDEIITGLISVVFVGLTVANSTGGKNITKF